MSFNKLVRGGAVSLVTAALLLTGCSGDDPGSQPAEPTPATSSQGDQNSPEPVESFKAGLWKIKILDVDHNADLAPANGTVAGSVVLVTFEGERPDDYPMSPNPGLEMKWSLETKNGMVYPQHTDIVTPAVSEGWPESVEGGGPIRHQVVFDVVDKLKGATLTVRVPDGKGGFTSETLPLP